jgi:alkaline phosphatase D
MTQRTKSPQRRFGIARREFLQYVAAVSAIPTAALRAEEQVNERPNFSGNPFTLGVASGDPEPDGVVIWTRLAPQPLEGGGMPNEAVRTRWEVATDEAFGNVVRSGSALAMPQLGHSVHVEVAGLQPHRWYFYRFHAGNETSPVGRTRTAPAADAMPDRLRFAFTSCQHYESGYFNGYPHMQKEDLDLVIHLGDYIYEDASTDTRPRKHIGREIVSLDDYRTRYAQYRLDKTLQDTHRLFPWLVTWDDHEFDNNYANLVSEEDGVSPEAFLARRINAYQAYYEFMPLRRRSFPRGPHMKLYRGCQYGRLANFHVLDTRQYRTDQPNGDRQKPMTGKVFDPRATILGDNQEHWLMSIPRAEGSQSGRVDWRHSCQLGQRPATRLSGSEVATGRYGTGWHFDEFQRQRRQRHPRIRTRRRTERFRPLVQLQPRLRFLRPHSTSVDNALPYHSVRRQTGLAGRHQSIVCH